MNRVFSPVFLFSALALAGCHLGGEGEHPSAESSAYVPEVATLTVTRGPLVGIVEASGTALGIDAADLYTVQGATPTEILVDPGDPVREGQILVRATNGRVSFGSQQAAAGAAAAEAQAEHAESELARLRPLAQRGTIPQSQLDTLQAQARAARAQATAARNAARSAQSSAADLTVRAPFDGVVTSVSAQVGEMSTGRPVARVVDLSTLELELPVHERDLPRVRAGAPVDVALDNLGLSATGEVAWVGREIDARTRTAKVMVRIDNADGAIPAGAFARATIRSDLGRDALVVPASAVGGEGDQRFVWRVAGGAAQRVPVEARDLPDGRVELLAGVADGEVLVASRTQAVRPGPVRVAGELARAGGAE